MIPFRKNNVTAILLTPEQIEIQRQNGPIYDELNDSAFQKQKAKKLIHIDEYLALGLKYPYRRSGVDSEGHVYLRCYDCKEGYCYEKDEIIHQDIDGNWEIGAYACKWCEV